MFRIILITSLLLAISAHARSNNNREDNSVPTRYPLNTSEDKISTNPTILENRFMLNIDEEVAKDVTAKQHRYHKIVNGVFDAKILNKPVTKPLATSDTLHVSTEFITTLMLPKKYKIVSVNFSKKNDIMEYSQNLLYFQPSKDFHIGNAIITIADDKSNYFINLTIEKYLLSNTSLDIDERRYVSENSYISTVYEYVDVPQVDPIDILKMYFQLHGEEALSRFKKQGDFDSFIVEGMPFFIIRDDDFWQVEYKETPFRISNKYINVN
jgi:hypothetical protein